MEKMINKILLLGETEEAKNTYLGAMTNYPNSLNWYRLRLCCHRFFDLLPFIALIVAIFTLVLVSGCVGDGRTTMEKVNDACEGLNISGAEHVSVEVDGEYRICPSTPTTTSTTTTTIDDCCV